MRAGSYIRVSSESQTENTSLEFQQRQIEAYARLKGLDIVASFSDPGVSGGMPIAQRPEGSKLTALIAREEIDCVLVVKLDRAFRNVIDCLQTIDSWEKQGVGLHIIDMQGSSIDSKSANGRFMLTVLAAACEMERAQIRDRCNAGRKARKLQGQRTGEVPYGWTLGADGKTLVENPEQQAIIKLIYSLADKGDSLRSIAAELNRRQVRTMKGGRWHAQQIRNILARRAG
jgi:DNA invertase Pin-like site-specific DNA recombinase